MPPKRRNNEDLVYAVEQLVQYVRQRDLQRERERRAGQAQRAAEEAARRAAAREHRRPPSFGDIEEFALELQREQQQSLRSNASSRPFRRVQSTNSTRSNATSRPPSGSNATSPLPTWVHEQHQQLLQRPGLSSSSTSTLSLSSKPPKRRRKKQ